MSVCSGVLGRCHIINHSRRFYKTRCRYHGAEHLHRQISQARLEISLILDRVTSIRGASGGRLHIVHDVHVVGLNRKVVQEVGVRGPARLSITSNPTDTVPLHFMDQS